MNSRTTHQKTVHPPTRGEHNAIPQHHQPAIGSSPHTWGTQCHPPAPPTCDRFIPTHVGNTSPVTVTARPVTVHPHTRGEHVASSSNEFNLLGSSPHTWGTLVPPANQSRERQVHPHTRGEHQRPYPLISEACGSSPHTWGTPLAILPHFVCVRFIPTHVGNTPTSTPMKTLPTVHPHTRGEHRVSLWNGQCNCGSSPHTWGTRRG